MKRILTILAVIVIVGFILLQLFRNKNTLNASKVVVDRTNIPVAVTLATVRKEAVNGSFSIPATLAIFDQANIPAAASGKIVSLPVDLGSYVIKGQVIGQLDTKENSQKLQADNLALQKYERDYNRNKVLAEAKATNANAVIDSKYDVDSKKLEIAQLETQINNANIVAPISGIISDRKLLQGEYATIGTAIATVVDVHQLKAKVYVSENKVFGLRTGQAATITTEAFPSEKFEAVVTYISPQGDDNHNYLVQLLVKNNQTHLKAGQYVIASFSTGAAYKVLQIPQTALAEGFKNPYVYLASDGKAVERKIVLGRGFGESVEVISGLNEDDQVVVNGQINITNGSNIRAVK
jgi:RND family efflux transporter MFP subunit